MTSRVGSPAYMDDRVDKRQDYDNTADIYSLGMVFISIFKGKGIYDECTSFSDLKRFKSEIYQDFENNIEVHINDLPQPIKEIVKNCLNPDYTIRYSAETIASMIGAKLTQDKSGSRNLISTQDDFDEVVESEKNLFACNLIALNR
jgi:serine/threonine protein kinase